MNNKYTIIKQESIEELNGTGYILKHDKTGARVVVISNEDDNKVFQIGFRTPPKDDTGVPHILEHSVLCGSREFPMKDPFCGIGWKRITEYIFKCNDLPR